MKKHLLFTFDYELFLGARSGLIDDCMIAPTEKLIAVFDKYQVQAIFFVDTTYLSCLKDKSKTHEKCAADFNTISRQLQQLIQKGHYVFPHIHPHWRDATYNPQTNQWSLKDVTHYRFHFVPDVEKAAIFRDSINVLKEIISPVNPSYQINSFRAGGWCLQPFSDFKPFFDTYGIKYDFSVLPLTYQLSSVQYFDFSASPEKPVYHFEDDVVAEKQGGKYIELGSSIINISPLTQLVNRFFLQYLLRIKKDHTYFRGEGQLPVYIDGIKPTSDKGISILNPSFQPVSMETFNAVKMAAYLRFFHNNQYMQFVSHPKMLSNHNIDNVSRFLEKVTKKYDIEFDFLKLISSLQKAA